MSEPLARLPIASLADVALSVALPAHVPQLRGRIGGSCPCQRRRPTPFTRARTAVPMGGIGS
eukprot:13360274-Alexandrium_andersonii.AAC.1